jgi:hypothetical protein
MARYFFHLRHHTDTLLDPDGVELADMAAVRALALRSARDTLSHEIRCGRLDLRYRIDVEESNGAVVHTLPLTDAFTVIVN